MKRLSLVLKELFIGILVYGIVVMGIGLLIAKDKPQYAFGLLIGLLTAGAMAFHMEKALNRALDLGEAGAQNHIRKTYMIRTAFVVLIFGVTVYFQLGSVWSCFLGVMGLKAAAYLQPFVDKLPFLKEAGSEGDQGERGNKLIMKEGE